MPPKRQPPRPDPPASQADSDAKPAAMPLQTSPGAEQAGTGASANDTIHIPSTSATPASSRPATPSTSTPAAPSIPSSRGSNLRGRGRGRAATVATPKFTGRRSATARAEAEKIEHERKKVEAEARAREDTARARREGGGRGGFGRGRGRGEVHRGRGRGGFMGERRGGGEVASGPFSAGQANKKDDGKRRAPPAPAASGSGESGGFGIGGGGGGGGGGGSSSAARTSTSTVGGGVKQEPGIHHGSGNVTITPRVKTEEEGTYISSDEEEEGVQKGLGRMNVEDLDVIDLTHDDDEAPPDPTRGFQPVRLKREAHVDRTLGLNADGATTKEGAATTEVGIRTDDAAAAPGKGKGKQRAKDVEVTGASEPFQATYSSSDEQDLPRIKLESIDDDGPQPVMAPPRASSPEPVESSRRKGKEREGTIKPRTLSGSAAEMPVHQTQDEVAEWERRQKDLEMIFAERGTQAPPREDRDGDVQMEADSVNAKREAKTYLFQFPPVLPDLTPIIVKPEVDTTAPPAMNGDAMDLDDDAPPGKDAANPNIVSDTTGSTAPGPPPKLPSGVVGKLRIHKSGKATLDWGGTKLSLGMATEASFLQDVVIMSFPEKKAMVSREGDGTTGGGSGAGVAGSDGAGEEDAAPGWAMGMGQVKGKFVVVPDWEDLLG
ncbi:hypothetical protein LTR33_006211 [Friedmanniomyces endolithicus]|nr:hypothetical protein LTR33_006211 [Friedmanniomyces endolithicus]